MFGMQPPQPPPLHIHLRELRDRCLLFGGIVFGLQVIPYILARFSRKH